MPTPKKKPVYRSFAEFEAAGYQFVEEELVRRAAILAPGENAFIDALSLGDQYRAANVEFFYILNGIEHTIHVLPRHSIEKTYH